MGLIRFLWTVASHPILTARSVRAGWQYVKQYGAVRKGKSLLEDGAKRDHFISYLEKRGLLLALLALLGGAVANAQDLGVVAPRTYVTRAFNAVSCAEHTFVVPDRGLNVHMIIYETSGVINSIEVGIDGSFDGVNYISVTPANSFTHPIGSDFAKIYMPFIRMHIYNCNGAGTITAYYSGSWGFDPFFLGPAPPGQPFACAQRANVSIAGAGDTVIISPSAADKSVVLCHLSFSMSTAAAVQIISGTGVNCATGTDTTYGAAYLNLLALALNLPPGTLSIKFPAGDDVCLRVTGATTFGGLALYAEQ